MGHGGIFGRGYGMGSLGAEGDSGCTSKIAAAAAFCAPGPAAVPGMCAWYVGQARDAGCLSSSEADAYKAQVGFGTKTGVTKREGSEPTPDQPVFNFTGQACDSDAVKKHVQGIIGTTVDGKWGPASQTALQKYGQPYKDIASGCTGNPPSYGAITGGGGGGTVTTTYAPPPAPPVASSAMSGLLSKPIVWVGLAMAAVGGYVLLTGKKKGGKVKKNARKRRKVKIVKVSWGGTRKKGK